jgi:hypothetical protein
MSRAMRLNHRCIIRVDSCVNCNIDLSVLWTVLPTTLLNHSAFNSQNFKLSVVLFGIGDVE